MPAELVRELILRGEDAALGGQEQDLSILFADIAGFTSISEELKPEELMLQLSEYLGCWRKSFALIPVRLDKYLGDGVMAFWGAPVLSGHHASDACRAALECRNRIQELNEKTGRLKGKNLLVKNRNTYGQYASRQRGLC